MGIIGKEIYVRRRELRADEVAALRGEVADLSIQYSRKEDELVAASAPIKSDMKRIAGEIASRVNTLRDETTEDRIECELVSDVDGGYISYVSVETGEVVHRRSAKPWEMQYGI